MAGSLGLVRGRQGIRSHMTSSAPGVRFALFRLISHILLQITLAALFLMPCEPNTTQYSRMVLSRDTEKSGRLRMIMMYTPIAQYFFLDFACTMLLSACASTLLSQTKRFFV